MSPATPTDHRWVHRRLAAFRLGLLTDAEAARVREHLESCEGCREFATDDGGEEAATAADGHIPATLIARWDRAGRELSGLERELVRRHLERCAECREDLATLGQPAVLEAHDPAPEPRRPPARLVLRPARGLSERWRGRLLAGWATLATAVALVLLVPVLRQPMPLMRLRETPEPAAPAVIAAPALTLSLAVAEAPQALRSPSRDGAAGAQVLRSGDSARVIALSVPAVLAPAASEAVLELLDADGRTLARAVCPLRRLQPRGTVLLQAGGAPVPPGRYLLRVTTAADGGSSLGTPEVREFRFEIAP